MKLIGAIAFLVLLTVGCQKEDIRPNSSNPVSTLRSSDDAVLNDDGTVVDEGGTTDDGDIAGEGITDPNDANRTSKTPKPKQPN
jgi:hypothetical protein